MTMVGGALVAIINMMNGIAGTAEKQDRPEITIIKTLIERLNEKEAMRVNVDGEKVTVSKGEDVITTSKG